jgi:hypothetical protein
MFTPIMRGALVLIQLLQFYAGTIFINSEGNKEMCIVFRSVYILPTGLTAPYTPVYFDYTKAGNA